MGRTLAIVGVVVVIVVAIAGVYLFTQPSSRSSNSSQGTSTSPQTTKILIASGTGNSGTLNFNPASLKVKIGVNNKITWANNDNTNHSVTFTSAHSGVSLTSLTDPDNLNAGEVFTRTLTVPGTYQYHCTFHTWMQATITVTA